MHTKYEKKYLRANPNGKIIIINTIVQKYLTGISYEIIGTSPLSEHYKYLIIL